MDFPAGRVPNVESVTFTVEKTKMGSMFESELQPKIMDISAVTSNSRTVFISALPGLSGLHCDAAF